MKTLHGETILQNLLSQDNADRLAEAALWIVRDLEPDVDIPVYLQRLHYYADVVCERLTPYAKLGDVLFHLNDYLFNDRGFLCDRARPYQLDCNLLNRVIDNRRGVPLSLAIIYLTVGRWLGLPLVGLSFPGRILIKYADDDGEVVIDPAEGGIPLQDSDLAMMFSHRYAFGHVSPMQFRRCLSPSDDKTLLVSMLCQLKQCYLLQGDVTQALWALENILHLVPEMASGFRERGYLYELLDSRTAAAESYNRYLELQPDASDAKLLRERLPGLLQIPVTFH